MILVNREIFFPRKFLPLRYISPSTIRDSTGDIQITNVLPPSVNDIPPMKRRKLILSNEEKQTILNGDMLTDESVNIAQNILSDQFPMV